jgi:hypothetical protein
MRIYLKMPLEYLRYGPEFSEAQRTLDNYCPATVPYAVGYAHFYLGFSRLGEALF